MGSYFKSQVVPGALLANFVQFCRLTPPSALLYVARKSFELDISIRVVPYDSSAEIAQFNKNNYEQVLGALHTQGATSFSAAFKTTRLAIESMQNIDRVVIAFMTDGQNTCGAYESALSNLDNYLVELKRKKNVESTCHVIAFTASHDFNFLESIRKTLGTKVRSFRVLSTLSCAHLVPHADGRLSVRRAGRRTGGAAREARTRV